MHPLPRVGTETPCDFMTVFYFLVTTLQFTAQDGDGIFIDFANSGALRVNDVVSIMHLLQTEQSAVYSYRRKQSARQQCAHQGP